MMEINAIIILCACKIGLCLLCPQAHFSPACQRMLGTLKAGARVGGGTQMIGTLPMSFPSLPCRVRGAGHCLKRKMKEGKLTYIKASLGHFCPHGFFSSQYYPVKIENSFLYFQVHETATQRG